ncbi:MAG: GDSL-type esterase/lipase family protein [Calditrichia bacterium]
MKPQKNSQPEKTLPLTSKTKLMLLAFPFILLGIVELTFRLLGLFAEAPLFLETSYGGEPVYQLNTTVAERYFDAARISIPTLYPEKFRKEKTSKTFRVFCLGGSTTAGFPFDAHVPFPHQLRFLLAQRYPNRDIEVINLGLSAINSFSVLDLVPEVLEKSPDLVIVYMGHNEFYGVYGSGSTFSVGQQGWFVRSYLKLRKLRLVGMVRAAILKLSSGEKHPATDKSLMEQVSADKSIALDSPKYQLTMRNFTDNLSQIVDLCQARNVPIFLSSLTSNLTDQPPLGDALDGEKATTIYAKALSALASGDTLAAGVHFKEARDYDAIRFRAASNANALIRELAADKQVPFTDINEAFEAAASPTRLPGNDLFCDHLHPNPTGYYILAKSFFQEIENQDLITGGNERFKPSQKPAFVTPLDWEIGYLKIYKMIHRWPFPTKQVSFATYPARQTDLTRRIAGEYIFSHQNWERAHYDMADSLIQERRFSEAIYEYLAVHLYFPGSSVPFEKMGALFKDLKDWKRSAQNYEKALKRKPANPGLVLMELAQIQGKSGNKAQAVVTFQQALETNGLSKDQRLQAKYFLAGCLYDTGNYSAAEKELKQILDVSPNNAPAKRFYEKLRAQRISD